MVQEFEDEYGIPRDWIGIYHSEVMSFLIENTEEEQESDFQFQVKNFGI